MVLVRVAPLPTVIAEVASMLGQTCAIFEINFFSHLLNSRVFCEHSYAWCILLFRSHKLDLMMKHYGGKFFTYSWSFFAYS